jgi:2-polyprenyl-6-methoxyphenol hydroxylase-like FAD-dependent oxidoreductase
MTTHELPPSPSPSLVIFAPKWAGGDAIVPVFAGDGQAMRQAQVIVSGASFAGIAVACRLAKQGVAVLLLDATDAPLAGHGAPTPAPSARDMIDDPGWTQPLEAQGGPERLIGLAIRELSRHPNAEIKFQHRVADIEQDAEGVTVCAETAFGVEAFRGDYLIVSDGDDPAMLRLLGACPEHHAWPVAAPCTPIAVH